MASVLITGGHKGIGLEATTTIARAGRHDIVMAGRNLREVEEAAARLRTQHQVSVSAVEMDIASIASVRAGAQAVQTLVQDRRVSPLQVLMLNAGAQFQGAVGYSVDGYEQTFATNYLGNFLLLHLLLDDLQSDGRIVFTASGTHDPDTMDGRMVGKAAEPDALRLADDGRHGDALTGGQRYSTSKLLTIMTAYELDRRLRATGSSVQSIAFDPGLIVETGLIRSSPRIVQALMRTRAAAQLLRTLGVTMGSIPFSGGSLARLAVDPEFADASGKYMQSKNGQLIEARSSIVSYDLVRAHKLWEETASLIADSDERTGSAPLKLAA